MPRTFAYLRVSTSDQTTDNQLTEIAASGFSVEPHRATRETISGSVPANQRPAFSALLDRIEAGDVLAVTKLDRLGRNAMDVRATVEGLEKRGVRVHCLALGGMDLTSPAGKMTMGVIAAVAEFERDLLLERTQTGISRARAEGKHMGRPATFSAQKAREVREKLATGASVAALAREYNTTRQTIMRVRDKVSMA